MLSIGSELQEVQFFFDSLKGRITNYVARSKIQEHLALRNHDTSLQRRIRRSLFHDAVGLAFCGP
jgi:hypothetical protein